jgi:predicted flavoprotein YhiN
VPYSGLADIDGAISTAGGVAWSSLSPTLALTQTPNDFCAGEKLDWEAPTGGYLIHGCLSTGLWAGRNAATSVS